MQIQTFKKIVSTFSDPGEDLLIDGSRVVMSVNGLLLEAELSAKDGDIYVSESEGGQPVPASRWVLSRLANLPLLADRLQASVSPTRYFVSPSANLLKTLGSETEDGVLATEDALQATVQELDGASPLETTVLYVTSDAGEGKTSLINQAAVAQAARFKKGQSDWLLVPIPLGGRHFLRFDDITIGALQNRYRFPFLYYSSFLELVKMGAIVPAFDGFEEMFVESSSGEALSAMGVLLESLDSQGSMVVAARKAYFEFESLKSQERLFDSIRNLSVSFAKLELKRWARPQFLQYCENRGVEGAEQLYARVAERLGVDHALLTRAVLVKRLVESAVETQELDELLRRIEESGGDFFAVFVRALLEREANEKWIDRSGEEGVGTALLSVDSHGELLAQVAMAMWESRVDYLKRDALEFVADYYCEVTSVRAFQAQQVRERLRGHAMLVPSPNAEGAVEFDHDEFRLFFLGEGVARLARPLTDKAKADVLALLRRGVIPEHGRQAVVSSLLRTPELDAVRGAEFFLGVGALDVQASYTQENCGALALSLLNEADGGGLLVRNVAFAVDSLAHRNLTNLRFEDCYFGPTSLEYSRMSGCSFARCEFAQLRVYSSTELHDVTHVECRVDSLVDVDDDGWETWDPAEILARLQEAGVSLSPSQVDTASRAPEVDVALRDFEKILRYFMRSTNISEGVIKMKLGATGRTFLDQYVPTLVRKGVLEQVDHRGGGDQKRFRLRVSLERLSGAIASAGGSFESFLENIDS